MYDQPFVIPSELLDWLAVFGYLSFILFVAWRVIVSK
jgi:hypothetical protein